MNDTVEKIQLGVIGFPSFTIAIDLAELREVVKLEEIFAIPGSSPCIIGGFHLRGENIPLLDLRYLLDAANGACEMSSVAVIVYQGLALGVLCETADDVLIINADTLSSMAFSEDGHELLNRGFHYNNLSHDQRNAHPALAGSYIYQLNVDTLFSRPEIIALKQERDDAHSQLRERRRQQRQHITLFDVAGAALALETSCVMRMLDNPQIESVTYATPLLLGEIFLDREAIPVVSMAQLMGLPRIPEKEKQAIVLSLETGKVVLLVNKIMDVVHCLSGNTEEEIPPHDERLSQLRFIHHLIPLNQLSSFNGGPMHGVSDFFIALDNTQLTTCDELVSIAGSTRQMIDDVVSVSEGNSNRSDLTHVNSPQVLGYEAGIPLYTSLDRVREILPMEGLDLLYTDEGKHQALLMFHMQAIPVYDLPYLLGHTLSDNTQDQVVLLTVVQGSYIGFIIDKLRSIDYMLWIKDSRSPVIQQIVSECRLSGEVFEACWRVCKTDHTDLQGNSYQYALNLCALGEILLAQAPYSASAVAL